MTTATTEITDLIKKLNICSTSSQQPDQDNFREFFSSELTKLDVLKTLSDESERKMSENPFFCVNLAQIIEKYVEWKKYFPQIVPHYAVKCTPDPVIMKLLADLGCGFDCASKAEIQAVLDLNVSADKIIFAHTIKNPLHLKYAASTGIDIMTFDNEEELEKIKENHRNAKLVLRIKTDDSKSFYKFSVKFGCHMNNVRSLLAKAKSLDLNVIGVSFHVGSKCASSAAYIKAIKDARQAFSIAKEEFGMNMNLLDIGGGFPGCTEDSPITFEDIAKVVNESLANEFNDVENLKIIAEPGRFFVTTSHTLVFGVVGKTRNEDYFAYYMNDGVYGRLNGVFYGEEMPPVKLLENKEGPLYKSVLFGPTCCGLDTIVRDQDMPELKIGDKFYVENVGAYYQAVATNFNGFGNIDMFYVFYT